jgi:trimethylamine--corrinoid protein Co-methyltransferase
VRFPENLVREAIKNNPSQFQYAARNPKHNITVGDGNVYFTNGFGAVGVLDVASGKVRPSKLEDLEKFTLLSDALENVHYVIPHCIPQDVPKESCDRYMALAMLKNTSKHCALTPFSLDGLRDIIKMVAITVGGEEALRKNPTLIDAGAQPTSPLQYGSEPIEYMMLLCDYKTVVSICVGPIAGATAPATLAGTVAQGNAEFLAGLVFVQALKPGTPVYYGSMATIIDPRRGSYSYGCPELTLMNVAYKQMAESYEMPFYGTGGTIDSLVPDEQAAYETTMSNLVEAMGGVDVIHDGVYGILESAKTACYEQLIISHEVVNMVTRILKGIEVNDKTLAFDLIKEVGPGRSFLEVRRSVQFVREVMSREYWLPKLTERVGSRREWEDRGSKDMVQKARDEVKRILETHKPDPPLEPNIVEQLKQVADASLAT